MELAGPDNPLPLYYLELAWDLMLAPDDDTRHSIVFQALRDYDHRLVMLAISLCAMSMRAALNYNHPTATAELREMFMEMAEETIHP